MSTHQFSCKEFTLDALDGPTCPQLRRNCGTVGMSYLEHSLKAYDYTKTVQSLRMLGWKNQSWRTRNQQGLLVAAGNVPLEFSMEEQLDPGSAASNLLLILVTSTTTKLPTIISTWAA